MPRCNGYPLPIGEVAKRIGVTVETIRYYEKIGLLARPARGANGHRSYTEENAASISFINRSRKLGFSLGRVRELMRLRYRKGHCDKARSVAIAHRDTVRQQIDALRVMDQELTALIDECGPVTHSNCPVIRALEGSE